MRFESVKAYAFGPFKDETLELAPGMNVVYGPNEAGKSSWHAALYAGLCGIRRARGRLLRDDAAFADRHRPWENDEFWDVGAIITLDDGRRVELRHDLAGRVDSSARDADLAGRDYSNEIISNGAPDGARWLGLDRRSFLMTSCIRQADILGLLESPSELQDKLQRAADTADRDGTAVEALARLREFRAEFVGSMRAPTKPLRRTEEQFRWAERQLKQAQVQHEEYLKSWINVDELSQRIRDADHMLGVKRAMRAQTVASEVVNRHKRALELHSHFPDGAPRRPSQDDDIVRQVASALTSWSQRPNVPEIEGETIPALEMRLAEVNLCLAVNAERAAREVEKRLERARELSAHFPHGRPLHPSEDDRLVQGIASALVAWELRPTVHEPSGPTVAELEQDLASVRAELGETITHKEDAGGGPLGLLLRALGALLRTLSRLVGLGHREPSLHPERRQVLEQRQEFICQQIAARKDSDQRWVAESRRIHEAAEALQRAATAVGIVTNGPDETVVSLLEWQQRRRERLADIDNQMKDWEELQQVLGQETLDELEKKAATTRDESVSAADRTDSEALAAAFIRAEPASSVEAVTEKHRMVLLHGIRERRREEKEYTEAIAAVTVAEQAVTQAARLAGIEGQSTYERVVALHAWQEARDAELEKADLEIEEWEELQRILGEDSLDELNHEVERLRTEARTLSEEVGLEDNHAHQPPTDAEFRHAESEAREARTAFDRAQSQLEAFAQELMDVAEAEEDVVAAKREYNRVHSLDHTLSLTISFLEQAEERVHRTIAPVLARTVREWLPKVTGGRYVDCRVDPENLAVEVAMSNGHWQRAEFLSHGTAEQVYLLLRFALARHLASQSCPLILDDAVAASDSRRKHYLLETLLAVSESTQVILFTHEDDVCEWARERLVSELHKVTELNVPEL